MATNRIYAQGTQFDAAPDLAEAATVSSGDPVAVGQLPAVALTDASDTVANGGVCTVQTDGVFDLSVDGQASAAAAAIGVGDIVYIDTDGTINVDATNGIRFGYALEAVNSAGTATIQVKLGY